MRLARSALLAGALLLGACGMSNAQSPDATPATPPATDLGGLLTYRELLARPQADHGERIAYGSGPQQFGELWMPTGAGPHPVVIMIHGGCWLADLPGLELQHELSRALRDEGYAVWNIEYRRIGHPGGGYPGTFQDVAAAADFLRTIAVARHLDLTRVVSVGHSAGGHLAVWLAARGRLPANSPLRTADPLPIRGVVPLAGIIDLAAYRATGPDACGGPPTIDSLVGARSRAGQDVYADTSPAALLPIGVLVEVIAGGRDPIVPPSFAEAYTQAAARAGDPVSVSVIDGAGHFELIDPRYRDAYQQVLGSVNLLAGRNSR